MTTTTEKATHTPGPWHVDNTPDDAVLEFVYDANGRGVAGTDRDRPDSENQANARLIAAAPELGEVLRELMNETLSAPASAAMLRKAQDALVKAGLL